MDADDGREGEPPQAGRDRLHVPFEGWDPGFVATGFGEQADEEEYHVDLVWKRPLDALFVSTASPEHQVRGHDIGLLVLVVFVMLSSSWSFVLLLQLWLFVASIACVVIFVVVVVVVVVAAAAADTAAVVVAGTGMVVVTSCCLLIR